MVWKKALKYPILIIGIVWFAIYLSDPKTADFWTRFKYRFHPAAYVCDAFIKRAIDQVDATWELKCPHTTYLIVRIDGQEEGMSELGNENFRKLLYNKLFNSLVKLINVSDQDNLESFTKIQVNFKTDRRGVVLTTDGPALRQLRDKIYLVKKNRLHHRATVELKNRGLEPKFNKNELGLNSKPINIDENIWNEVLKKERDALVKINLKNVIANMNSKDGELRALIKGVKEYDPNQTDAPE